MIAASKTLKSHMSRTILAAAIALGAAILPATQAGAVSAGVRYACAGDYLANCSAYAPDSAETRRCMRAVGYNLSKGCLNALVAAGEVSKSEVGRRSAKR
jgi:predicted anti-sigma-YlaC factor YlaD